MQLLDLFLEDIQSPVRTCMFHSSKYETYINMITYQEQTGSKYTELFFYAPYADQNGIEIEIYSKKVMQRRKTLPVFPCSFLGCSNHDSDMRLMNRRKTKFNLHVQKPHRTRETPKNWLDQAVFTAFIQGDNP